MRDFEDLVRTHQGAVCATAYSVLRDRARSEEIAQDAFLIAWRELPAMSPPPTLPGWICGIARNLARNAARKRKGTPMQPGSDIASTSTPLDTVLDREANEIASQALAALSERDREVVVLYYHGEQSLAEVASVLGITETSARQRLHRGRERLKAAATTVEAMLRATRPGPAFTIACVAALAAGKATPAAAAPTAATSPWLALVIGGALVTIVGGVVMVKVRTSAPAVVQAPRVEAPTSPSPRTRSSFVERISAAARAEAVERAQVARAGRVARAAATTTTANRGAAAAEPVYTVDFSGSVLQDTPPAVEPSVPAVLSKSTLRYGILLVQPLLLDCYKAGHHDAGQLKIHMRLIGDATADTVVESVDLDGDAAVLGDAARIACLRDTLLTIELPPMTDPGTWDVTYPFMVPE